MFKMNLQLFAHKKGGCSTKNGRDSESKRVGERAETKSRFLFTQEQLPNNSSSSIPYRMGLFLVTDRR